MAGVDNLINIYKVIVILSTSEHLIIYHSIINDNMGRMV